MAMEAQAVTVAALATGVMGVTAPGPAMAVQGAMAVLMAGMEVPVAMAELTAVMEAEAVMAAPVAVMAVQGATAARMAGTAVVAVMAAPTGAMAVQGGTVVQWAAMAATAATAELEVAQVAGVAAMAAAHRTVMVAMAVEGATEAQGVQKGVMEGMADTAEAPATAGPVAMAGMGLERPVAAKVVMGVTEGTIMATLAMVGVAATVVLEVS